MGESPLQLSSPAMIRNPVLTARDVTDGKASFVADPFLIKAPLAWYMFFEVMDTASYKGKIGVAVSRDGLKWKYERIVLEEPFHLSYPYVFNCRNEYYMIPECYESNSIRLYKAVDFPMRWSLVGVLLEGAYVDTSIFRYEDRWWLFTANQSGSDTLSLFFAEDLMGPWREHPSSPVIKGNAHIARPGGRILMWDGRIVRFTQDDDPTYGNQLRAFEITKLTTSHYVERSLTPNPLLKGSGSGWNAEGMHHIDLQQTAHGRWLASVDGYRKKITFRLKY
ncbi:MAG: hypothetical protein HYR55_03805 [Acidobacteria bacterium]|nr:hypothetical protein [Acidobacteriota bacterium]